MSVCMFRVCFDVCFIWNFVVFLHCLVNPLFPGSSTITNYIVGFMILGLQYWVDFYAGHQNHLALWVFCYYVLFAHNLVGQWHYYSLHFWMLAFINLFALTFSGLTLFCIISFIFLIMTYSFSNNQSFHFDGDIYVKHIEFIIEI